MVLIKKIYKFKRINVFTYSGYRKKNKHYSGICERGFIVVDKYKFHSSTWFEERIYRKFLKRKPEKYFYFDFPYYLTNLLINGTEINSDQQLIDIINHFNSLPTDKNYSKIEIEIIEPNKKWKIEDKRYKLYEQNEDFELYDEKGNIIYVAPNDFILEKINN